MGSYYFELPCYVELMLLYLPVALLISLIVLIIYFENRGHYKKIIISIIIFLFLLVLAFLFFQSHPTYYKYNDKWVIGNKITDVENRYGEFDLGEYIEGKSGKVGYYIYKDDALFLPDYLQHYYIEYDEYGNVYSVEDSVSHGG